MELYVKRDEIDGDLVCESFESEPLGKSSSEATLLNFFFPFFIIKKNDISCSVFFLPLMHKRKSFLGFFATAVSFPKLLVVEYSIGVVQRVSSCLEPVKDGT